MRRPYLLLALSLLWTGSATAQGTRCDSAATTREIQACLAGELLAADDSLKSVEATLRVRASSTPEAEWRQLQAAWIEYRDKECALRGSLFAGGTLSSVAIVECRIELTRARASQLGQLLRNLPDGG